MYKIEVNAICGWEPFGHDDYDEPLRYSTLEEARLDIYENHMCSLEAIDAGYVKDTPPLSDFRIILLDIAGNPVLVFSLTSTGTVATATPC